MNEFEIYVFSKGEYSDYKVLVHYQGPKDYDFTSFYEAFAAQSKIIDLFEARWGEENPCPVPSALTVEGALAERDAWRVWHAKSKAWREVNSEPPEPFNVACKILESHGFIELNNITEINIDGILP